MKTPPDTRHAATMTVALLWAVHRAHEEHPEDPGKALRSELARILRGWSR